MKKVVLVQRNELESNEHHNSRKLKELEELAYSAGYSVIGKLTQTRNPNRNYNIGPGKVEELANLVSESNPDKIIFYNQLSVMQIYNISEKCKCETIDKFNLILEIFALKARTKRAQYQVELAKLQYELPKAKTIVSLLKKSEKPGFMGLGGYEDSYETDLKNRISRIKKELKQVQKDYENLRQHRHEKGFSLIALAGYTNAGKSTLFNNIVNEDVEAEHKLFTTLSPTTRSLDVNGRKVLVTDTVGFIENLPHWLVDSFKSTLDEIFLADMILLVVDISEDIEDVKSKLITCHNTLWEEIEAVPIITVINKIDKVSTNCLNHKISEISYLTPNPIMLSAKNPGSIKPLIEKVSSLLPEWKRRSLKLPISSYGMSILSWLFDEGIVHEIKYTDKIIVDVEARDEIIKKAEKINDNYRT